jgi:hypothetical protein
MSTREPVNIPDYCRRGAVAGGKNLSAKPAPWKMLFIKCQERKRVSSRKLQMWNFGVQCLQLLLDKVVGTELMDIFHQSMAHITTLMDSPLILLVNYS